MKIFDISVSLHNGMPFFPGDPAPDIKRILNMPKDAANVSFLCMGSHTGTHVDPPLHFIENGTPIDRIPLDHLYGRAEVLDLTHVENEISAGDLENASHGEKMLLFKTRNSQLWQYTGFRSDFAYLNESGADWVVRNSIKTIAIDYLSIGSFKGAEAVHKKLLGAGVTVVEGVDLTGIEPGKYTFACLPLKIKDGDGSPARAILVKE